MTPLQFPAGLIRAAAISIAFLAALPAIADESQVVLTTETGEYEFTVELVDTPQGRSRGLMFREELADDAGMLFDFHDEQRVSFWMMNTLIPLDMIFVRADGVVENVHVNARPQDPTGIPSSGPVQYVLEIPGGRSVEIGLKAGDTMAHDRIGTD